MSHILYIDPFLPLHDRNSGSLRLYRMLQLLRDDKHDISYLPHTIWAGQEKYAQDLIELGIEILRPPTGTHTDVSVSTALQGRDFDTVIISFYNFAASYSPFIRQLCPNARIVVDTIDLHFLRERRQSQITGDPTLAAKAKQTHHDEIAAYADADALIAISPNEKRILQNELPEQTIYVVPNVHELGSTGPSYEDRNGLVFVGNFWHPPNGEGIVWFCNEVWPRIIRRVPTITLDVIGQDPPSELMRYLNNQVRVHGWVQTVQPFLDASRLSIAPLLHGAGLKGKVGEALAVGLPVVTTSIGAEGLSLSNRENAMVADGAEAFADAVVTAHQSPELWHQLAANGQDVIRSSYTPQAVRAALRQVIPAPSGTPVNYFGVPDWDDVETTKAVLDSYVKKHALSKSSNLHFGVFGIDVNDAYDRLTQTIASLGYDPETIPDVTLTPISSLEMGFLNPDTVWVPMRDDIDRPDHLVMSYDLASEQATSSSTRGQ